MKTIASPSDSAGRTASRQSAGIPAPPSPRDVTVLGDGPGPPYWRLAYVPAAVHGSTRRTERQGPAGYAGRSAFRTCTDFFGHFYRWVGPFSCNYRTAELKSLKCTANHLRHPYHVKITKTRVKIHALTYICSIQKFADSNNYRSISEAEWLEKISLKI